MIEQKTWGVKALLFFVSIALLLAGCAAPTAAPTPLPPTATTAPATSTSLPPTETLTETPTQTPLPPTSTTTRTPTEALPTATASPSATATLVPATSRPGASFPAASGDTVRIYYIQLDTGGPVGCGDSVLAVGSGVEKTGDVAKDVAAGLKVLLASKWEYSGALYNPLHRSNIKVQHVKYDDGLISVWLTGDYNPSGDDCDNTRVKAQIWSTIRQFRDVERTNIYLNEIPFGDRLSNDK